MASTIAAGVLANPIPGINPAFSAAPIRWLAHPTQQNEQVVIDLVSRYGISVYLFAPVTLDTLGRQFDRFASVLVSAQRPPHAVQFSVQGWYRERANRAQRAAMTAALREWLTAKVTEAPHEGTERIVGPPEAIANQILEMRLRAAEALGDWRDTLALPQLKAMSKTVPRGHQILIHAMRRITDPSGADVFLVEENGRVVQRRPHSELDSMTVTCWDPLTSGKELWHVDRSGLQRIWKTLSDGSELRVHESPTTTAFTFTKLDLFFHDGLAAHLEGVSGTWDYMDNGGRQSRHLSITNRALLDAMLAELARAHRSPHQPRFVSESVTLLISRNELRVRGVYQFEGAVGGWLSLLYPTASDRGHGPAQIERVALHPLHQMDTKLLCGLEGTAPQHRILLRPGDVSDYELEVDYRQSLSGRRARYLVTTARAWGRPLRHAQFFVSVDSQLGTPHFPMHFDEAEPSRGQRRFFFDAAPFSPDTDLVVSW